MTGITNSTHPPHATHVVCLLLCAVVLSSCEPAAPAPQLPVNLQGVAQDPLADVRGPAVVLLFVRTDCPVTNRYVPRLLTLQHDFGPMDIAFVLVYPDASESPDDIAAHHREYDIDPAAFQSLRDIDRHLVKISGASMTPEAAVYVPTDDGPELIYRGRIDDQFVDYGKTRAEPTTHDLQQVLTEVTTSNTLPQQRTTQAVGCPIPRLR